MPGNLTPMMFVSEDGCPDSSEQTSLRTSARRFTASGPNPPEYSLPPITPLIQWNIHIGKPGFEWFTYMHIPYGGYRGWRSLRKVQRMKAALGHPIGGLLDPGGKYRQPLSPPLAIGQARRPSMSLGSESISAYRRTSSRSKVKRKGLIA